MTTASEQRSFSRGQTLTAFFSGLQTCIIGDMHAVNNSRLYDRGPCILFMIAGFEIAGIR